MKSNDIVIVGGGLGGLTAAIHLKGLGYSVLVIEKKKYPHHKVCGEYVSNEIMPYLQSLGIDLKQSGAVAIDTLQISTRTGASIKTELPLGGIGISRYAFDMLLYKKALTLGVIFKFETATSIRFYDDLFEVQTDASVTYMASIVIGAYGKRSGLDKVLQRDFIENKSSWLAVKGHYSYPDFPDNLVALHNFKGGYGGLSKTESGNINFCYLVNYQSFKEYNGIEDFNNEIVAENPHLKTFLQKANPIFDAPMTIAQISFESKNAVENHVLMCGDAAGLIHPLCGNGMAMAIHAAKIASEHVHRFLENKSYTRNHLELDYETKWNKAFRQRLWIGRRVQSVLLSEGLSKAAMATAIKSPKLLKSLIRRTHGKPINV
ncbi:FAD-dependent monooxygenase [Aurantibacter crassamenti]|uniref:NAD(P)/FAD-dependent oxidoreductase n=1 Tax=Aurantibacter crassamenti TaxID=1837375 RepID=UPI00193953E9|nr:FAD-dependent monooxygenase [Aurantibacter crassamenti]MBM1107212.1 FAD-dependent monooxygenase [Aurantibacter crassamenti]